MKRVFLLLILCFTAYQCFGQVKKDLHPDFSGTWVFKAVESNNKIPGFDVRDEVDKDSVFEIVLKEPEFRVTAKLKRGDQYVVENEFIYYTDDRGETNERTVNGRRIAVVSKTKWDRGKLVITYTGKSDRVEMELSNDGKTFTRKQFIKTSFDKFYVLCTYTRSQ